MEKHTLSKKDTAKILISFSLPLIFSGILQQLYSWADAFIVGHVNGEAALAAIGSTTVLTEFLIQTLVGFTAGLSILAAQRFGEKRIEDLRKILFAYIIWLPGLFLLLVICGRIFIGEILSMMKTPADIMEEAREYLGIILWGVPMLALYNLYSAIIRAMGNSKIPFYSVLVSSVMNVILDLILVWGMKMGVGGAAIATVVSQGVMTLFMVAYSTWRYPNLRLNQKDVSQEEGPSGQMLLQGLHFGLPLAIQSSLRSLGNLVLQSFANGFGTATVAAIATAYRVDLIMILPIMNLGTAISTMVAQSEGAHDRMQIRRYLETGLLLMVFLGLMMTTVMSLFGGHMVAMFGVGPEVTAIGRNFFHNISIYYLIYALAVALRGTVEGHGRVIFSSVVVISTQIARIFVSYGLAAVVGNMAIAHAEGLQWVMMFLLYGGCVFFHRKALGYGRGPIS